jgi:hypothetical protein
MAPRSRSEKFETGTNLFFKTTWWLPVPLRPAAYQLSSICHSRAETLDSAVAKLVYSLLKMTSQLMCAVIRRRNRRRSRLDLKTLDLALELRDTLFQPKDVLAVRVVHA